MFHQVRLLVPRRESPPTAFHFIVDVLPDLEMVVVFRNGCLADLFSVRVRQLDRVRLGVRIALHDLEGAGAPSHMVCSVRGVLPVMDDSASAKSLQLVLSAMSSMVWLGSSGAHLD